MTTPRLYSRPPAALFPFVFGSVLLAAVAMQPLRAQPKWKAVWLPPLVEIALEPGQTFTDQVIWTSDAAWDAVTLEATPSLRDFMAVMPLEFNATPAGQFNLVTIEFSVSTDTALGSYEGTIHLRDGRRTIARPLGVIVHVVDEVPPLPTAEEFLLSLSALLEAGDKYRALAAFKPSLGVRPRISPPIPVWP